MKGKDLKELTKEELLKEEERYKGRAFQSEIPALYGAA